MLKCKNPLIFTKNKFLSNRKKVDYIKVCKPTFRGFAYARILKQFLILAPFPF